MLFGFRLTREPKLPVLQALPPTPVKVPTVDPVGNGMVNPTTLMGICNGVLKKTTPVGREVINGKWYLLFVSTNKAGVITKDKHGNVILNRVLGRNQ